jgi:acyl-CoA thioesterase YciA
MLYRTRKVVMPGDLNPRNILFGGRLLSWLDEECFIYATCQLDTTDLVTKYVGEIEFLSAAKQGDIVEIGVDTVSVGTSSIVLSCEARNKTTQQVICRISKVVFVHVGEDGKSRPHGKSALGGADQAVS